jgi:manganese/iron transport system substrate-binding protein
LVATLASTLLAGPAMAAEKFKALTAFTAIADIARNVADDAAVIESITKPGAEIHDYQPTPGDIRRARGVQLTLLKGLDLDHWFERFLANIRDALARYAPANAEAYKAKIAAVITPIKAELDAVPNRQRWLATNEGAFSYLARDFRLRDLYLRPINADSQGTPQQVRKVIDAVRQHGIGVVFAEGMVSSKPAEQVAAGSITAPVGVNGSGKSALFKATMGFVRLARGSITVFGLPVAEALRRNLIAYIPRSEEVDWNFPVLVEDVVMTGRYGCMGFLRRIVRRPVRAGVAGAALAQDSRVILLDEPFTGVDLKTEEASSTC